MLCPSLLNAHHLYRPQCTLVYMDILQSSNTSSKQHNCIDNIGFSFKTSKYAANTNATEMLDAAAANFAMLLCVDWKKESEKAVAKQSRRQVQ